MLSQDKCQIYQQNTNFFGKIVKMGKISVKFQLLLLNFCIFTTLIAVECKKSDEENKPKWAKKDIRDYTDVDLERLLDQWDVSFFFIFVSCLS
jgi:hypothetical protein